MRRPLVLYQAKWLFLGLLKTTASALATTASTKSFSSSSSSSIMLYSTAATTTTISSPFPQQHQQQRMSSSEHRFQQQEHCQQQQQLIQLRVARATDVASIAACNLQTLPENYNDQFYLHHLSEWPDLAIVAVIEQEQLNVDDKANHNKPLSQQPQSQQQRPTLHSNYHPESPSLLNNNHNYDRHHHQGGLARHFQTRFSFLSRQPQPPPHVESTTTPTTSTVVAYLLGKVCPQQPQYLHCTTMAAAEAQPRGESTHTATTSTTTRDVAVTRVVGHVSSLAVLPDFRRQGLADAMLQQFHAHLLWTSHSGSGGGSTTSRSSSSSGRSARSNGPNVGGVVSSTGLHVRCSNTAAVKLYQKVGYWPAVRIPTYYEDGEDAYYMQKILLPDKNKDTTRDGDPRRQLPRSVGVVPWDGPQQHLQDDDVPELLTGTL